MSGNYVQPVDNNMDYGAEEMRADELRRIQEEHSMARGLREHTPKSMGHYGHGEERAKGLHNPHLTKGMLTHSKAHSSFVATPATMVPKAQSNLRRGRGKSR